MCQFRLDFSSPKDCCTSARLPSWRPNDHRNVGAAWASIPLAKLSTPVFIFMAPLATLGIVLRIAGAERDVTNDARQARANRAVREFRNRYDLWRA
jgi:hypothetical protein